MANTDFASLPIAQELLTNLKSIGYHAMTPIQAQSLPSMLEGRDVIAQGKTGSGKTAAFGLATLHKLKVKQFRIQTLVLCPTRELADQVAKELRKLARMTHNVKILTLCGGMPFGPQVGSLEHGAHIVVGTPGRIEEHVRKGNLKLDHTSLLILDEADRMLDMGFQDAIDAIVEKIPSTRQTLLFSATYPNEIERISKRVTKSPLRIQVESNHDHDLIEQCFFKVPNAVDRIDALRRVLLHHQPDSCVIFCNTKKETQELTDQLCDYGFAARALHGDMEQKDRDITLICFANKSVSILLATDVAARGLDIESLDMVINYHIARNPEVHVHRIGRTGRAENKGLACSLVAEKESHKLERLGHFLSEELSLEDLPHERVLHNAPKQPEMVTIQIDGGKKQKMRPGDLLGALTKDKTLAGSDVGKITVSPFSSFVAIKRSVKREALNKLKNDKIKGRQFRSRLV